MRQQVFSIFFWSIFLDILLSFLYISPILKQGPVTITYRFITPNDHPDLEERLEHLINAIKMVYAWTILWPSKWMGEGRMVFSSMTGNTLLGTEGSLICRNSLYLLGEHSGKEGTKDLPIQAKK